MDNDDNMGNMDNEENQDLWPLPNEMTREVFDHVSLEKLIKLSRVDHRFLNNALAVARRKYGVVAISLSKVSTFDWRWLETNIVDVIRLLGGVIVELDLHLDFGYYMSDERVMHHYDLLARHLISRCTVLEKICFREFPNEDYKGFQTNNFQFNVPQTVSTLSFVGCLDSLLPSALNFLHNFHHLRNLNILRTAHFNTLNQVNLTRLLTWFQNNRQLESIWLPDEFYGDLGVITDTVHTIRIHIGNHDRDYPSFKHSKLNNLKHFRNLTRLRIDCRYEENTTEVALDLLQEYGDLYAESLEQLHLCCNFARCTLRNILHVFTNLKRLIIVHYAPSGNVASAAFKRTDTPLEENLPWPQNLVELRCYGFSLTETVLRELAALESLRKLDIYCCHLQRFRFDIGQSRINCLEILLDYHTAQKYGHDHPLQKYVQYPKAPTFPPFRLINVHHRSFRACKGLNIRIQFVGIEEAEYDFRLCSTLNPLFQICYAPL